MKKKELPLSPHLQIYKPQITSILSITHRITGFALNFSLVVFVIGLLSISSGEKYYSIYLSILKTLPFKIVFFLTILGFTYHLLNGFRHILWDFGLFLENRSASIFGYIIIILSLISSIYVALILGLFS
ncbi:MAG: succinate dehydrogenase, cytochrome b556 subunit [Alphaproteobacteria bacterium]|tara:strand:+ start:242 stop:628 length:387 start_codon:yes stop_codon:yes gene_type:complete